jgi:hypothetical protein
MTYWFYMIRSIWRVLHGRWYVWRDVPTDVVRKAGALWLIVRNDKSADDNLRLVILQARNEYKLRKRKP